MAAQNAESLSVLLEREPVDLVLMSVATYEKRVRGDKRQGKRERNNLREIAAHSRANMQEGSGENEQRERNSPTHPTIRSLYWDSTLQGA